MTAVKEINSIFNYIFSIITVVGVCFTSVVFASVLIMNDPMLLTRVGIVAASFGILAIFGLGLKVCFLICSK